MGNSHTQCLSSWGVALGPLAFTWAAGQLIVALDFSLYVGIFISVSFKVNVKFYKGSSLPYMANS